jgi:chaperonin GroES
MNLRPLNDRLIVKALPKEEVTKSGIILPDTMDKEKPEQGEVIAVGPGKLKDDGNRVPMSVKAGDKIMFKQYAPDEIKIENEKYLVLSEYDILAVVDPN